MEAFARNHRLPIEWAEKGVREEDHVLPWQRRMARDDAYGVYFIFKSMEQGPSFRISVPKYATNTQAALGCLDPPGLAAQFLDCGGFSNAYRSGIRHGGAFDLKQATWAFRNALADARDPTVKAALAAQDIGAWFRPCPGIKEIRRSASHPNTRTACSSNGRTAFSTITGSSRGSMRRVSTTAMPMCRSCICRAGTTPMHAPRWRTTSACRGRNAAGQLVLGPWTHGDRSLSHAGEVEFGPAAPVDGNLAEDFFELRRRWFDRWIKGLANGVDEEPTVRVFGMGGGSGRRNRDGHLDHGGCWRSAAEWPLPQTRWTPLYLHADRSLAAEPAAGSGAVDYAFDPRDPTDGGRRDQLG